MRFLYLFGLVLSFAGAPAMTDAPSQQSIKTLIVRYQRLDKQVNDITFCALRHRADRPAAGLVHAARESMAFSTLGEQIHGLQRDIEWAVHSTAWTTMEIRSGEAIRDQRWLRQMAATVSMMNVTRIYAEGCLAAPTAEGVANVTRYRAVWSREEKRLGLGHRL